MTRREGFLLLAAAVLAAGLAWQYWPAGSGPTALAPVKTAAAAPGNGLNPLAGRTVGSLTALAAHPLFAKDRAPPAVAVVEPAAAPAPQPLEVVPPAPDPAAPAPVLQGVVATPFPGGAYLGDGQGGDSIFLRPGQAALGLTLEEVFADHATFMGPDGEVTLTLTPAPPPAAAPDAAAPNP